jgi:RNA-directed DNA polymerase
MQKPHDNSKVCRAAFVQDSTLVVVIEMSLTSTLHHRSDKSLQELAKMYNPYIQGWINYYGNFYRTQLCPTLKRIDLYVIRWARRKFKRLRHQTKGARNWFARLVRANPKLFAHWQLCHGNGRTTGAV